MTRPQDRLKRLRLLGAAVALSALAACGGGGGGGGGGGEPTTYTVGGLAAGLNGPGLVLRNGTESLSVPATGSFTFVTRLAQGASYAVSVVGHPANQTCSATNASGTVGTANVTNIAVACVAAEPPPPPPNTYTVGGEVTGMSGTGMVLTNNGVNDLAVTANGAFTFSARIATGLPYAVAIATQPGNQTCTVANASGLVGSTNISNVTVHCGEPPPALHTISGTVSNLTATGLILHNNGGDPVTIAAPATPGPVSFTFPARVAGAYNVTVAVQPGTNPDNSQDCTVGSTGAGTATGDVSNVAVTCGVMGPLTLLGSDPPQGATDVPRTVQPVLNFSRPLDPTTVHLGTALSREAVGTISTVAEAQGSMVTLRASDKLLPKARYVSHALLPLAGQRGEGLVASVARQFTTADNTWLDVKTIAAPQGVSDDFHASSVALDDRGNAIAAWVAPGGGPSIQLSHYTASRGIWEAGSPLTGVAGGPAFEPQLAMDDAGNALLVWMQLLPVQNAEPHTVIWAARYSKDDGWNQPRIISHQDISSAQRPSIAVRGSDGKVAVAWMRTEADGVPLDDSVWLSTSTTTPAGAGWSDAVRMDVTLGARVENAQGWQVAVALAPQAASGSQPEAVVLWAKPATLDSNVYIWSRMLRGDGLLADAQALSDGSAHFESQPQVAFDAGGDVHAVWRRDAVVNGTGYNAILSNSWSRSSATWLSVNRNPSGVHTVPLGDPKLAKDGSSAIWTMGYQMQVWPREAAVSQPLPATQSRAARQHGNSLVVDAAGNAVAAWTAEDGQVVAARRTAQAWSPESRRIDIAGQSIEDGVPLLAVNRSGTVLAVWVDSAIGGSGALRARFFD